MTSDSTTSARSRLTATQERDLSNLAASWAMEGMDFADAELEIVAAFMLGQMSRKDCMARLRAC